MSESSTKDKTDQSTSNMVHSKAKDSKGNESDFDIPTAAELDQLGTSPCKTNSEKTKEVEDIPQDFFDDFLNQDFMAGLDVVDAWDADEDGDSSDNKKETNKKKKEKNGQETRKKSSAREDAKGSKDSKHDSGQNRRDPSKTKRDIQRDKDKCAKDREVKLIKEKLKVVETGLVPPGMEMEVDLTEIQKQNAKETALKRKRHSEDDIRRVSKSRSREEGRTTHERKKSLSGDRSFYRNRSRSKSPLHRHAPSEKKRRSHVRSVHKFDLTERSHRRPTCVSPVRDRPRQRSPEIGSKTWRYFASNVSPEPRSTRRTRGSSNDSDQSDRERWLSGRNRSTERTSRPRNKASPKRRSISRDRSFVKRPSSKSSVQKSPLIKVRCKSFLEELDAKLAKDQYFKEVHQKLNATTPAPVNPPTMVQPPNVGPFMPQGMIYHQQPMQQSVPAYYDEQFFVGQQQQQQPPLPIAYNYQPNEFEPFPNAMENPCNPSNPNPVPPAAPFINNEKDVLKQLFTDKKISLSDYLHITAKSSGVINPLNIQNKIKVISRCQDAIKELSGEPKRDFVYVKSCRVLERTCDTKHQSPLKKQPLVRFGFTTLQKPTDESLFTKSIHRLMAALRITNEFNGFKASRNVDSVTFQWDKPVLVSATSQTVPLRCDACDKRNARKCVDQAVQTVTLATMYDVGVQVHRDDIERESSLSAYHQQQQQYQQVDPLKTKSLAYLTPAELLGQLATRRTGDKSPMKKQPSLDAELRQQQQQQQQQHESLVGRNVADARIYGARGNSNGISPRRALLSTLQTASPRAATNTSMWPNPTFPINAQTPYPNNQNPFPNAQTPFPNNQTPFPNAQNPFPNNQNPYANTQNPYANNPNQFTNQNPFPNNPNIQFSLSPNRVPFNNAPNNPPNSSNFGYPQVGRRF